MNLTAELNAQGELDGEHRSYLFEGGQPIDLHECLTAELFGYLGSLLTKGHGAEAGRVMAELAKRSLSQAEGTSLVPLRLLFSVGPPVGLEEALPGLRALGQSLGWAEVQGEQEPPDLTQLLDLLKSPLHRKQEQWFEVLSTLRSESKWMEWRSLLSIGAVLIQAGAIEARPEGLELLREELMRGVEQLSPWWRELLLGTFGAEGPSERRSRLGRAAHLYEQARRGGEPADPTTFGIPGDRAELVKLSRRREELPLQAVEALLRLEIQGSLFVLMEGEAPPE
jgi:hypothetical protein